MPGLTPTAHYPDIIIALNLLGEVDRYHWLLFVADPESERGAGTKIHVTDRPLATRPEDLWHFEHQPYTINSSQSVCAAAVIGKLPAGKTVSDLISIVDTIPLNEVPAAEKPKETKFSCRLWVREAVRRLHAAKYLVCSDVDALEKELRGYAAAAVEAIENETFTKAGLVHAKASVPA